MPAIDFNEIYARIPAINNFFNFKFKRASVADIISSLLPYIFAGAGVLLLIYLILAGFELMTSAGEPKKIESARNKITSAILGFGIIFVAWWLTWLAGNILGLQPIKDIFSNP